MVVRSEAHYLSRLKFSFLKFILLLLNFTFIYVLSACSIASIDLDKKDLEIHSVPSQPGREFPIDVIAIHHAEDINVNDLDLGKALKKTVNENLSVFKNLDIKKLTIFIYKDNRRQPYNFGFAAPVLLPLIEESKLNVSWSVDLIDGSSKIILKKSVALKEYYHTIFIPYGLVMAVIRPFNGTWISPFGFWANFISGDGAIFSNAIEINRSMIRDYSNTNISNEVMLNKN